MEERPQFALSLEHQRAGFDRIMAGLDLPRDRHEPLFQCFHRAEWDGLGTREAGKGITAVLAGVDWRWPWLEGFGAAFDHAGIWPLVWDRFYRLARPLIWADVHPATRSEMLFSSLYRASRTVQDVESLSSTQGIFTWTLKGETLCPVESAFVVAHSTAVEAGDYTALPPFFPGDGIRLQPLTKRQMARRKG